MIACRGKGEATRELSHKPASGHKLSPVLRRVGGRFIDGAIIPNACSK
jgi:hypothetical protein